MAVLSDRQFEMDGYLFGHRAPNGVVVTDVDFGSAEARSNDVDRPRSDGIRFGREWRTGRSITLELAALDQSDEVLTELGKLCAAWDAAAVRRSPGSLSVLRYNVNGRTRRVYGRPRKLEMDSTEYRWGKVLVTVSFDTEGPYFYSDVPVETSVGMNHGSTGGFGFPMSFPAHTHGMGSRRTGLLVPGMVESPVVLAIRGPIKQPIVDVSGLWSFQLLDDLEYDHVVTIDTRPWAMSARRSDGVNVAGRISVQSPRMREMWLRPGSYDVILRGVDPTSTASLTVQAWPAFASF